MFKKNKKIKIAINGFGRIGRLFFKMAMQEKNIEIVAINSLGDVENFSYLLNYDTAQKSYREIFGKSMEYKKEKEKSFFSDKKNLKKDIPFFSIKNPAELPWKNLDVDVVVECTGVFNSFEKSSAHLKAGAKKVVLSGPTKDAQEREFEKGKKGSTILMGLNEKNLKKYHITSNGSCTTNASAIPLKILDEKIGVENAFLNTIHSYTSSQEIVDNTSKKDFKRGRAAAQNIVPTSTGAAKNVAKVLPIFSDIFEGVSVRVPTISGSLADITFISKKKTTAKKINEIFKKAQKEKKYQGILRTEKEQIVSSDILGDSHACIVDLNFTKVSGKLVKIFVWYDNEAGFTNTLLKQVLAVGKNI